MNIEQEPEVVHREAIAKAGSLMEMSLATIEAQREAIAKKDAALQACVELMQYIRSVSSFERNGEIDAAITQTEEAHG